MKPINVDLPYPLLNDLTCDVYSAKIILPSYAGGHGELSAILQYIYHAFYFDKFGLEKIAKEIRGIAVSEMEHLEILGNAILAMGIDPVYAVHSPFNVKFFSASNLSYSRTPEKMLLDDIAGEMLAIKEYSEQIENLNNDKVSAIITRIRLDEELHVKVLKDMLKEVYGKQ